MNPDSSLHLPSTPARDVLEMDFDFDLDADTTVDVFVVSSPSELPFLFDDDGAAIPRPTPSRPS